VNGSGFGAAGRTAAGVPPIALAAPPPLLLLLLLRLLEAGVAAARTERPTGVPICAATSDDGDRAAAFMLAPALDRVSGVEGGRAALPFFFFSYFARARFSSCAAFAVSLPHFESASFNIFSLSEGHRRRSSSIFAMNFY